MALATDGDVVVFVLYRRGVYGIGLNADEHWRMPLPNGPIRKRRNETRRSTSPVHNNECWRPRGGGRVQRTSLQTGQLLEAPSRPRRGTARTPLKHESHDLLWSTDSTVTGCTRWSQSSTHASVDRFNPQCSIRRQEAGVSQAGEKRL